jgi:DNA-binding response OmpR family regulator
VEENRQTLLVVEDDLDIADMLNAYFRVQGYDVLTVNWGEDGVRVCQTSLPNLVILDIRLPDIDGFEVAKRLRSNRTTKDIPIIFLTEKRERVDRLRGLELQADDYITKPFDIQELRLRVRNALSRSSQQPLTNSVTGLPEGALLDESLEAALDRVDPAFAVLSIQNLAKFRELYGFVACDDLMRAAAMILKDALAENAEAGTFLGQLRPDWFVLTSSQRGITALEDQIRRKLDPSFEMFYSDEHREAGVFAQQPLVTCFYDAVPPAGGFQSLAQLKNDLIRLCR